MELAGGRCNVRDCYVCSFPRRHDSVGLVLIPEKFDSAGQYVSPREHLPGVDLLSTLGASPGALNYVTVTYWS